MGEQLVWTQAELERRLIAVAGRTRTRHVNSTAAGKALGVSERTVRRWLERDPDAVVGMKPANAERVFHQLRPSARKLHQEQLDKDYAVEAITTLSIPSRRRRMPAAWKDRQWVEPHLVAVLDRSHVHLRQVTVARVDHRPLQRMHNRGQLLDSVEVPTRFHATVLMAAVLEAVDHWRVQTQLVSQGNTQCWVDDAPAVDLRQLAVTNDLV